MYTLDPKTFTIVDPYEKRPDKQKLKRIGIIDRIDDNSKPTRFKYIRVHGRHKGILEFDLTDPEQLAMAMYAELHPKLSGGQFADKNKAQVFSRIDETQLAKEQRAERSVKLQALNKAQSMSDNEVQVFADAMQWDKGEELEVVRARIEDMAENESAFFNEILSEGNKIIEYMATLRRAEDAGIVIFDPAEYRYIWGGSNQTITVLQPTGEKAEVEKMADWLITGGDKADQVYKKIKSLLK
jgi:hypothetical protein